jgi:hypothetical protein
MKKLAIWSEDVSDSFEKREGELTTAAVLALVALGAVTLINLTTEAKATKSEDASPTDA